MTTKLVTSCVVLVGCVGGFDGGSPEPVGPVGTVTSALVGETEQGTHILGGAPDLRLAGGHHFRVRTERADALHNGVTVGVTAAADGTHLTATESGVVYTGTASWFDDMILEGVDGGAILIDKSETEGSSTKYHVMYGPGVNGPWSEYCDDATMYAIPLRGWYDRNRIHHDDADMLSFGCPNGVTKKCDDWGYRAGNGGRGDHDWQRHQACTTMANAMYCMDGNSKTREETPILLRDYDGFPYPKPYDLGKPDPMPGDPDTYYLEAGWRGAPPFGPVCLSRLRWRSLPPDPCPNVLPDPRSESHPGALFCDELSIDQIAALGGLVFNGSKVMDAPIDIWRGSGTSTDRVTTFRGYFEAGAAGAEVAPFPGYTHVDTDSMILRNLPGSLDKDTQMFELDLWQRVSTTGRVLDRVIARAQPTPDYANMGLEGYSFATQMGPEMVRLRQCAGPTGFYTTIDPCPGGAAGVPQGWAMPPP